MARLIQREIKDPLADEILFGKLKRGGSVLVREKDDHLDFTIEENPAPPKKEKVQA
jgi:ATP-dependent Clp protease ATP-binding subunit ClpA